jgi:hypothetical protein
MTVMMVVVVVVMMMMMMMCNIFIAANDKGILT